MAAASPFCFVFLVVLLGRQHQSIYLAIFVLLFVFVCACTCTLRILDDYLGRALVVRPLSSMLVKLPVRLLKWFLLLLPFLDIWLPRHFLELDFFRLGSLSENIPSSNGHRLFLLFFQESRILTEALFLIIWLFT